MNNPNRTSRLIFITLIASLLLAVILTLDILPFLRGGEAFNWQWPYHPVDVLPAFLLAVATAVYVAVGWRLIRQRSAVPVIAWALFGAAILPVMIVGLRVDDPLAELFNRTISPVTTGPHLASARIDWAADGFNWLAVMQEYRDVSIHVALSPPALPALYAGISELIAQVPALADTLHRQLLPYQCHNYTVLSYTPAEVASAGWGMLMPLWAALTILPLYAVAQRLINRTTARYLVLIWALVPAAALFTPTFNTLYPLLAVSAFWMLLQGYRDQPVWWVASGLLTGLLTFANFSLVPLAGLFGFYALLTGWRNGRDIKQAVIVGLWFGIGFFAPWLGYGLLSGISPLDMLSMAFDAHLALERPYIPWLWMHSWEWVLMTGLPLVIVWLSGWRQRTGDVLPQALLVTFVILLLSDTARGETGRVWLFFAPFLLIVAGQIIQQRGVDSDRGWRPLMIAQAALFVALVISWEVIGTPDITPPPSPPPAHVDVIASDSRFADDFTLTGWSGRIDGDIMTLSLNWRADNQMTTPYYFAALAVAPDGSTPVESVVWQPDATRYPTTCWPTGEVIGDTITIELPADRVDGDWYVSLSAFADVNDPAGSTLTVYQADGAVDGQVGLGPVTDR